MSQPIEVMYPGPALDTQQPQIRLLTLCSGTKDDPIVCKLTTVDVNAPGQYEALSYVWGTSWTLQAISVNEKTYPVGENLLTALVHLRLPDVDRVLWIDAICINQGLVSERNHQVRQMADIYSRARQVIAWLGLPTESSRLAAEFLREAYLGGPLVRGRIKEDARWHYLNELSQREYWTRLWIIQEICLAKSVVVICGHDKIPWAHFASLRKARLHVWTKYLSEGERIFMQSYPARFDEQRSNRSREGAILWTLLETFRGSRCKVFNDRVYALLALSTDCGSSGIPVDYKAGPLQLHRDVMSFYASYYSRDPSVSDGPQLMRLSEFLQDILLEDLTTIPYKLAPLCRLSASKLIVIPICNVVMIQMLSVHSFPARIHPLDLLLDREKERSYARAFSPSTRRTCTTYATFRHLPPVSRYPLETFRKRPENFLSSLFGPDVPLPMVFPTLDDFTFPIPGFAPPGSMPGDFVCSFVDTNIAIVVRRTKSRDEVALDMAREALQKKIRAHEAQKTRRRVRALNFVTRGSFLYRKSMQIVREALLESELEEKVTRTLLEYEGPPERYEIIGRGFFDLQSVLNLDGTTMHLTRDKSVAVAERGMGKTVSWPGALTINMETLQQLSVPGSWSVGKEHMIGVSVFK